MAATVLTMLAFTAQPELPPNMTAAEGRVRCSAACRAERHWRRVVAPYRSRLRRMAFCESRGRWHLSTGNGFYGGLQFTRSSWRAVGGSGYPHRHSRLEQSYRAVRLVHLQGWGAWPVCQYA